MSQPNPQPVQARATQPEQTTTDSFAASVRGIRTVAFSLLVDRALSA
jgi:hypothetical protein